MVQGSVVAADRMLERLERLRAVLLSAGYAEEASRFGRLMELCRSNNLAEQAEFREQIQIPYLWPGEGYLLDRASFDDEHRQALDAAYAKLAAEVERVGLGTPRSRHARRTYCGPARRQMIGTLIGTFFGVAGVGGFLVAMFWRDRPWIVGLALGSFFFSLYLLHAVVFESAGRRSARTHHAD